jgi:hypothetical protein
MTAIDPFTQATATFTDAIRHPFKSGDALQVFPRRRGSEFLAWCVSVAIGFAVAAGALLCGLNDMAALVCGVAAGGAVRLADGWSR